MRFFSWCSASSAVRNVLPQYKHTHKTPQPHGFGSTSLISGGNLAVKVPGKRENLEFQRTGFFHRIGQGVRSPIQNFGGSRRPIPIRTDPIRS
jgi:hypothetical protein